MSTIFISPPLASRYVDQNYAGLFENGSQFSPYTTIQEAVDDLETNPSGGFDTVIIRRGIYAENIVVKHASLELRAEGGYASVMIAPAAGVPLTITNATTASLATYRGSDNYTDLLNDGAGPLDSVINGVYLWAADGTSNGLELLGVKGDVDANRTNFLNGSAWYLGFWFMNSYCYSNALFRNTGWISTYFSELFDIHAYNCGNQTYRFTQSGGDFYSTYDTGDANGYSVAAHGGLTFYWTGIDDLELNGTELMNANDKANRGSSFGDVNLNDTSSGVIRGGYIRRLETAGGASFLGENLHIQLTVILGSGVGTVQLDGGAYMGALTDPDVKLVRNVGN